MRCPDNYSQWENRERQHEAWLARRPVCVDCDEHIQDDHCFEFNGEYICPRCLEDLHRKDADDSWM